MNILLINPPRSPYNGILQHATPAARRFIHKKLIGPPLGLLTVAAAVKDHNVSLLEMKGEYDLHPEGSSPEELTRRWLERTNPRLVGITVISSEWPVSLRILKTVKAYDPRIITVVGGLHATLCPQDLYDAAVDIAVPGMSAHTFREIAGAIGSNRELREIPGIMMADSGALRLTAPTISTDPAGNDFLMPDRSLVRPWLSTYFVGNNNGPVTYLFTSLGCPCSCSFCSIWPQFNGNFMQRDIDSIIAELKTLDEYPVVRFADANTVVSAAFIDALFDQIALENIRKEYVMDIRFDTVVKYPRLIEKMAKQGLKVVICGFESFRQEEIDNFKKSASAADIAEAVRIFDNNGIMVRGNYVISPSYTRNDFQAIAEYAATHRVGYAGYTILTPMPGTQLYTDMNDEIVDRDLEKYNFFNCVLKTALPLDEFYRSVADLWGIRKGGEVI